MKVNIIDFISLTKLKNGKYKVMRDDNNLENTYRLLREMGYGYIKENSRNVYFKKGESGMVLVRLNDFQKAFFKAIKDCDLSTLPGNVTLFDVYNYYRRNPLKRNAVFARYFEYNLIKQELKD